MGASTVTDGMGNVVECIHCEQPLGSEPFTLEYDEPPTHIACKEIARMDRWRNTQHRMSCHLKGCKWITDSFNSGDSFNHVRN